MVSFDKNEGPSSNSYHRFSVPGASQLPSSSWWLSKDPEIQSKLGFKGSNPPGVLRERFYASEKLESSGSSVCLGRANPIGWRARLFSFSFGLPALRPRATTVSVRHRHTLTDCRCGEDPQIGTRLQRLGLLGIPRLLGRFQPVRYTTFVI